MDLADFFPPADPLAELTTVLAMADEIEATLQMAVALAQARRDVELAGLDRLVGHLCARALDLPPDQGRATRPRLQTLCSTLDGLAVKVTGSG